MTAGLKYSDSFRGTRVGGWHTMGTVAQDDETATEMYGKVGPWPVQKVPLFWKDSSVHHGWGDPLHVEHDTPVFGIIGMPNRNNRRAEYIATVTNRYHFFPYEKAIEILDGPGGIHRPVDTMGLLDDWTMFVCYELPKLVIRGDEQVRRMVVSVPVDGKTAFRAFDCEERVVCRNTYNIALGQHHEMMLRAPHDSRIEAAFKAWLREMYERFVAGGAAVEEALTVLANARVQSGEGAAILAETYPLIPAIDAAILDSLPKEDAERRIEAWEFKQSQIVAMRDAARDLYMGEGRSMMSEATKGTFFGLFQAVTELENYRAGRGGEKAVATSVVFGDRKDTIQRAFDACMLMARSN